MDTNQITNQHESEENNKRTSRRRIFKSDIEISDEEDIVTECGLFWIIFSIITHFIDILTDLNLAREYLFSGQKGYFIWTTIFIFVPSFINVLVSVRMYQTDSEMESEVDEKNYSWSRKIVEKRKYWPLIIFLQLAPVLRCIDALKFGYKTYQCQKRGDEIEQKKNHTLMIREKQDISLLHVFECFLEAAPHQVLQLCLILIDYSEDQTFNNSLVHQLISMTSSLVSMGWAMASYHETIRLAQADKADLRPSQFALQFSWHFLVTVSRIIAISAAATICSIYTACVCFVHWFIITMWIAFKPSGIEQFCRDKSRPPHLKMRIHERINTYLLCTVFGVISIFVYFKPDDKSTFCVHTFYYIICALENVGACLLWIFFGYPNTCITWYYNMVAYLCIAPFIVGVCAMILYYWLFHPSKMNKIIYKST